MRTYDDRPFLTPQGTRVEAIPLSHDGGPTFGFRLECKDRRRGRPVTIGYVSDTGTWWDQTAEALAESDLLALEFNHDVAMQRRSRRSPMLIARNLGDAGHLSNAQGAALLGATLERSRPRSVRHLVLLHLSEECNSPRAGRPGSGTRGAGLRAPALDPGRASASGRSRDRVEFLAVDPTHHHGRRLPLGSGLISADGNPSRIVSTYFASDVHLRADRPDRGERFDRFLDQLQPGVDRLIVVGDLCDFWFASRQVRDDATYPCAGLKGLVRFTGRGGDLTILPGNHDAWIGPFYESALGARFAPEGRIERIVGGRRILATHGHRLGARSVWKHAMESKMFLRSFQALPDLAASQLECLLDRNNEARQAERNRKYLDLFRRQAADMAGEYDLVVLGHVHQAADFADMAPRVIVLGDWKTGSNYLRVDDSGVTVFRLPGGG